MIGQHFGHLLTTLTKHKRSSMETLIDFKIPEANDLKFERELGKGNFGKVYLAKDKFGKEYAVKEQLLYEWRQDIKCRGVLEKGLDKQEIKNLRSCDSPYVVKLYEVYQNEDLRLLLLQYCQGVNLSKYDFPKNARQREEQCIEITAQITLGLQEIHARRIIHRDLKGDNIIIQSDGKVKIIDLGFSRDISGKKSTFTQAGDEIYMAPEIYMRKGYDMKVDIWSLGVILYTMLANFHPFIFPERCQLNQREKSLTLEQIKLLSIYNQIQPRMDLLRKNFQYSEEVVTFLEKLLKFYAKDRYSWQDLCNDPIFESCKKVPQHEAENFFMEIEGLQ